MQSYCEIWYLYGGEETKSLNQLGFTVAYNQDRDDDSDLDTELIANHLYIQPRMCSHSNCHGCATLLGGARSPHIEVFAICERCDELLESNKDCRRYIQSWRGGALGPSVMHASGYRTDGEVRRMTEDHSRDCSEHAFWFANDQETYSTMQPMQAVLFPRSMTLRVNNDNRQLKLHDVQQREAKYMPSMINAAEPRTT